MNSAEDWDAECIDLPKSTVDVPVAMNSSDQPSTTASASQAVLAETAERPRSQNSRVFYNQQFSNNRQNDTRYPMARQNESQTSLVDKQQNRQSWGDSHGPREAGGNFNYRPDNRRGNLAHAAGSSQRDFNRMKSCGRGRGTLWEDEDRSHYNDRHNRSERYEDRKNLTSKSERPRSSSNESCDGDMPKSQTLTSKSKRDNSGTNVLHAKDGEDPFPALVQSANATKVPNFWHERRAFIVEARPKTEDEEAEMMRRAMEESRLMEEERLKKELEEQRFLLELEAEANNFPSLTPTVVDEASVHQRTPHIDNCSSDASSTVQADAVDAAAISPLLENMSVRELPIDPKSSYEPADSADSLNGPFSKSDEAYAIQSSGDYGDRSFADPVSTASAAVPSGDDVEPRQNIVFSQESGYISSEPAPDVVYQEFENEPSLLHNPPAVIYQTVPEGPGLSCSASVGVDYQHGSYCDASLDDGAVTAVPGIVFGDVVSVAGTLTGDQSTLSDDQQCLTSVPVTGHHDVSVAEVCQMPTTSEFPPVVAQNSDVHLGHHPEDVNAEVCYVPSSRSPSPDSMYYPEPACCPSGPMPYCPMPYYPMMPIPVGGPYNPMAPMPGYQYYPTSMPAYPPWPYGMAMPGMMMPAALPAPPPGFIAQPMYSAMPMPAPMWYPQGMPSGTYSCVAGDSMLQSYPTYNANGEYMPTQKDS